LQFGKIPQGRIHLSDHLPHSNGRKTDGITGGNQVLIGIVVSEAAKISLMQLGAERGDLSSA